MRNEIKFIGNKNIIHNLIEKNFFRKKYNDRTVNSIYFDDTNLKNYFDSIEGTIPRKKIRCRWYGDADFFNTNKVIELKKTLFNKRKKIIYDNLQNVKNNFDLLNYINKFFFRYKYPQVKISYIRSYFENNNGYRITLEKNIKYYKLDKKINILKFHTSDNSIVELKIDDKIDYGYLLKKSLNQVTRFSKYCDAIDIFEK